MGEGFGWHPDGLGGIAGIDNAHGRFAPVMGIHKQGDIPVPVRNRAIQRLDGWKGILPDIIDQPFKNLRLRFNGQNPRASPGTSSHPQRITPDIRADVDENEIAL